MNKDLFSALILLFFQIIFSAPAQQLTWSEVAPGVWKSIVGDPDAYDLLKAAGSTPKEDALSKMDKVDFPFPGQEIVGRQEEGNSHWIGMSNFMDLG